MLNNVVKTKAYASGLGLTPPELDILQKLYYLRKGDYLFSHIFCLLICRLNANKPRNKFACKFQGTLQMGEKVIIRFQWESALSSASRNHLTAFCRAIVVFRDSSLYPKQLPLFCLLRLISASADPIGYLTNFCSMIELLHELKNSSC